MLISHDTVFFFHNKTTSATYKSQKRSSEQSVTQRGEGEKVGGHIIPSTDKDPLRNDKEEDGAQMDAFHMVWVEWDFALVRLIVGGLGLMLMWG